MVGVWASGHLFSGLRDVELEASDFGPADVCSQDSGMLSSKPRETYVGTPRHCDSCLDYSVLLHLTSPLSKSSQVGFRSPAALTQKEFHLPGFHKTDLTKSTH